METDSPILSGIIVFLAVITILLQQLAARKASPILAIYARWTRWIFFSLGLATSLQFFAVSTFPVWILSLMSFIVWFLFETVYYWFFIGAISRSSAPIFPKYRQNENLGTWPNIARFIALKDWLHHKGFHKVDSLVLDMGSLRSPRSTVYADESKKTYIQVTFVPNDKGSIFGWYNLFSKTKSEDLIVTDNIFMPYGGFYPEHWRLVRKPCIRKLDSLLKIHEKRLEEREADIVSWDFDPLHDLNKEYRNLDLLNTQLGFLNPVDLRDEHGKITLEGRYRLWKELWSLNYLGKSLKY